MEDIVAVAVELEDGSQRYFLTWGRIQNPVDPAPLEQLVLRNSAHYALNGKPIKAYLCKTLQEATQTPGFYECFFAMCQKPIPFGRKTYWKWRKKMDKKMQRGKELYYLGLASDKRCISSSVQSGT